MVALSGEQKSLTNIPSDALSTLCEAIRQPNTGTLSLQQLTSIDIEPLQATQLDV